MIHSPGRFPLAFLIVFGFLALTAHLTLARLRVSTFSAPLHDEPITLLAATAGEGAYADARERVLPPFGSVSSAWEWQKFVTVTRLASLSEIGRDVTWNDKHPPLGFWLFNRWLVLLGGGGYRESFWFCHLMVLLAGGFTALAAWQVWRSPYAAALAGFLFLLGNSAVQTSSYVRQYAPLSLISSVHLCGCLVLLGGVPGRAREGLLAAGIALAALAGMLTQYLFAVVTLPLFVFLLVRLLSDGRRRAAGLLFVACGLAAVVLPWIFPGVLFHFGSVGRATFGASWGRSLSGFTGMFIPVPAFLPLPAAAGLGLVLLLAVLGLAAWAACDGSTLAGSPAQGLAASVIGSALLQLIFTSIGVFPAWATTAVYLVPLWGVVSVLSAGFVVSRSNSFLRRAAFVLLPLGLAAVQLGFLWWNVRNPLPESVGHVAKVRPDLVVVDRTERGYLLPLMMALSPAQSVLVPARGDICAALDPAAEPTITKVLWLIEDENSHPRIAAVTDCLYKRGWTSQRRLATRHPGMHDALLLEVPRS